MRKTLLIAVCLGIMLSAPAFAGIYYEATTKADGRAGQGQAAVVKGWVHGDKARVEFVESGNPMMAKGGYMLTKDGGPACSSSTRRRRPTPSGTSSRWGRWSAG